LVAWRCSSRAVVARTPASLPSSSSGAEAPPPPIIRLRYVVVPLLLVVGYFVVTGLFARHQLERAKYDVEQLRHSLLDSDQSAAHRWMSAAQSDARSAHRWLAGPAWGAAEHIPWVGRPARVARGLADVAVTLAVDALPSAVEAGDHLTPERLRDDDGAIRLGVFRSAASPLAAAATAADVAARQIARLPGSTWLPAANHARDNAGSLVDDLRQVLRDAGDASRLAPDMLGGSGTRRYILVVENDAEARGLGGLPGVVAILTVKNGRMSFDRFENNSFFGVVPKLGVSLDPEYRHTYAGDDVLTNFQDSNVSPDFPTVGKVWVAMWRAKTGEQLDGAIAADPTALSYLLDATGPAKLPDGSKVSGRNVVALTQQKAYSRIHSLEARQDYFIEVAKAASSRVVDAPHGSAQALVRAMSRAVSEHRLMLYSEDPTEQATLEETPLAGGLPVTRAPFVGVVVNNGQGSKLDYYLHQSVTYHLEGCSVSGQQLSTVTVRLFNDAPEKLPAYVTIRLLDTRHNPVGSERLLVALYTTNGAQLLGVTGNGSQLLAAIGSEKGHSRYEVDVTINRGDTMTLVYHLIEPKSALPVQIWKQPAVQPVTASVTGKRCE
jgi:hypothetical protein